jgi:CTP:molybdopterin cytidylyltransferase MocA
MTLWERIEQAAEGEFHEVIALVGRIRAVEASTRQLVRLQKLGAVDADKPARAQTSALRVALESIRSTAIQLQKWAEQWETELNAAGGTDRTRDNETVE